MNNQRSLYIYSLSIALLLLGSLLLFNRYGLHSRKAGIARTFADPRVAINFVDRPKDVYRIWKELEYKGRVVLALSARAHFVPTEDETDIIARMVFPRFPVKVFNLVAAQEDGLNDQNFLYLAMKTGIAREVIHVLPDAIFEKNMEKWQMNSQNRTGGMVYLPFFGSPRYVATLSNLKLPAEPLLLFVSPSFFRDQEPLDVWKQLQRLGVTTDSIVLTATSGDQDGTQVESQCMLRFSEILEGKYGKDSFK